MITYDKFQSSKHERNRQVPHLKLQAITWPANDTNVTSVTHIRKRRKMVTHPLSDQHSHDRAASPLRLPGSSQMQFTVNKCPFGRKGTGRRNSREASQRPVDEDNEDEFRHSTSGTHKAITRRRLNKKDDHLALSTRQSMREGTVSTSQICDSSTERVDSASRSSSETPETPLVRKSIRKRVSSAQQASLEPPRQSLTGSGHEDTKTGNLNTEVHGITPQSIRPSAQIVLRDSDSDIEIIGHAPHSSKGHLLMEEEPVAIKKGSLPTNVSALGFVHVVSLLKLPSEARCPTYI